MLIDTSRPEQSVNYQLIRNSDGQGTTLIGPNVRAPFSALSGAFRRSSWNSVAKTKDSAEPSAVAESCRRASRRYLIRVNTLAVPDIGNKLRLTAGHVIACLPEQINASRHPDPDVSAETYSKKLQ
jgi:hypothetical protein